MSTDSPGTIPVESSTPDALIVLDEQGRVVEATRLACDLTGYTREDLLSCSLQELSSTPGTLEASRLLGDLQEEATIALDTGLRVKDGSTQPFHLRLSRLSVSGRRHSLVRVARRRRAADRLLEDPEFIRTVLEGVDTLLFVLDPQGRFTYFNKFCESETGYAFREIRGKGLWDLLPEASDRDALRSWLVQLERGKFPAEIEHDWKTKAGGRIRQAWSNSRLLRPDGSVRYIVGTGLSSALRGATPVPEPDVRRLNERLERRVEERTAQLEDAIREMASFSYTIAHDLRAPLRSMSGFAQAMVDDYGVSMDAACLDLARRVVASARKMDTLIGDLLAYGRLIHLDVRMESVNLEGVVRAALERMGAELASRETMIDFVRPVPMVRGNRVMLDQVLTNLLSNAIKFVPPGVPPRVRIWSEFHAGRICLSIEDNGIGIAPEFHDRIFGIFQRLNREEDYPGTGIGLAIVRKALERMGGRAGVESSSGRGSRFWIELAAAEPE
ncbi:MAG TPA: ATP-binding protein [Planctomycetota bacterium]|jgi:PAS domain S-box-containing protein|nr:ATP-binding protein [Planctomycetota bacterium]